MAFASTDRKNVSRFVALLVATFAGLALAASTAAAATVQATCSDFGTTLAAATSNETIQLTGLCSSSNGFMGGGELIVGARVTSVGDSFTQDSIPGPDGVSGISWGAGLSTLGGGTCAGNPTVTSTFTNLVATGNMMGAPTGGATSGGAGAGIYAGCSPNSGGSYHLT